MRFLTKKVLASFLAATAVATYGTGLVGAGWVQQDSNWQYTQNGATLTGLQQIGSTQYYFDETGNMKTGWISENEQWYYGKDDGILATGWFKSAGNWYFSNSAGVMQTGNLQIDGVNYTMDSSGKMTAENVVAYPAAAFTAKGAAATMILPKKDFTTASVVIQEGASLIKVANLLNDKGICQKDAFLKAVQKQAEFTFNKEIPSNVFYRYEGYLFPDTYELYRYEDPTVVVKKLLGNFEAKMSKELLGQIEKSEYSLHEVLTLASIVEAEARETEDMQKVAAVYQNRLKNPKDYSRLQANPTTTYAKQNILAYAQYGENAETASVAYDSYQQKGLIPGPINNPGLRSIQAVLNPDPDCDATFFCTDKSGKFYFASTLAEHNENLIKAGLRQAEE